MAQTSDKRKDEAAERQHDDDVGDTDDDDDEFEYEGNFTKDEDFLKNSKYCKDGMQSAVDSLCSSISSIGIDTAKRAKLSIAQKKEETSKLFAREVFFLRKYGLYELLEEHLSYIKWIGQESKCKIHLQKTQDRSSQGFSASKTIYTFSRCGPTVTVEEGDITEAKVDMIVNTTGDNFTFTGPLATDILQKVGPELRKQCEELYMTFGNEICRVTEGGNLPCKKILHVQVPSRRSTMDRLLKNILENAEENSAIVLAIPAIGSGKSGWRSTDVANGMYKGITNYLALKPVFKSLQNVKIVLLDTMTSEEKIAFHSTFGNFTMERLCRRVIRRPRRKAVWGNPYAPDPFKVSSPSTVPATSVMDGVREKDTKSSDTTIDGTVQVTFASDHIMNVEKAKGEVTKFVNSHLKELPLFDDAVSVLTRKQSSKIKEIGFDKKVGVEIYEVTKEIVVQGEVDIAHAVVEEIRKILQAIPMQKELPKGWKSMSVETNMQLVSLEFGSEEYMRVETSFKDANESDVSFKILSVDRIQNPALYNLYLQNKKHASDTVQSKIVERDLFHGTDKETVENICRDGFNRSYAGKNGTRLGRGVYFSNKSSTSHPYGNGYIFLAHVLTGDFCSGNSSMVDTPVNPYTGRNYDSAVDNLRSPSIFVVYRDAFAYPAYIIKYQSL